MRKTILIIVGLLIFNPSIYAQKEMDKAPPLKLEIEVNGENHQIIDGESIVVNGNTIKVTTLNTLTFDYGGITFDYQKHFAFEHDSEESYDSWVLDGNDFVISYFRFEEDVTLEDFLDQMISQFGKKNTEVIDKNMQLGKVKLSGKRMKINLVGALLTYDLFLLDINDAGTYILSFQDSKNEDGTDSNENIATLKLINKTFKI